MADGDILGGHGMAPLHKKLGPLPLWGWGLVAGAIAVAFMYWRNSQNAANAADAVATPDLADSGASDTPAADAGTEQEFTALENDFATLSTGLSHADQVNTTQTKQIHGLQQHKENKHKPKHEPPKHHHPTPHGGNHAKPHHPVKHKHPKVG